MDKEIELEVVENEDYTLLGNRVEQWINACIPNWIIKLFKGKENDCGCDKRKEWLNDWHFNLRMKRLDKAESNYNKALHKLNQLKIRYKLDL